MCERNGADFFEYMAPGSKAELHHFIGKDIVNFHGLFWPAVLHGAGMRAPTRLHVNGYLTVDGAKMSKSRGTFVMARTYLDSGLPSEALRYYRSEEHTSELQSLMRISSAVFCFTKTPTITHNTSQSQQQ